MATIQQTIRNARKHLQKCKGIMPKETELDKIACMMQSCLEICVWLTFCNTEWAEHTDQTCVNDAEKTGRIGWRD